jgi:LmbE family N-acetylglucosaminyl deacetylase
MTFKLSHSLAEIFVPDAQPEEAALARTTHLGIGAHHDDLEFMAAHGIIECFAKPDRWFTGVIVTDGAGSARDFDYKDYSDEQMKTVRRLEQKKAAFVGEYAAQLLLSHPSSSVKDPKHSGVHEDLVNILRITKPEAVYTHNLADKHDTHVAVCLRVIAACRKLAPAERPKRVIGCEVWRDLDWLCDKDKVVMPVDGHENLQAALMGVFDSQIVGGKRYDLATAGRRKAHATYFESHSTDQHTNLIWGMDLTPIINSDAAPMSLVETLLQNMRSEVEARIAKLS